MEKQYSIERPPLYIGTPGRPARTINFNIESVEDEQYNFSFYSVIVPLARWNYDYIVSAIIEAEYPNDRMQAVINNYLLATREDDVVQEFAQMQQWRAMAKQVAHEVLGIKD